MTHHLTENIPDFWAHAMRRGEYTRAWEYNDRVLKTRAGKSCWHLPRHFQYIWDGTPLEGKRVLVRCYHGLGDTIQFIRYAPLIKSVAREVIVWAQPKLISLLQSVEGIDRLLPLHDGTPEVAFDIDVEVMELPYIFRSTLQTIPAKIPYMQVDARPFSLDTGRPAVGLVWRAGDWDEQRSMAFSMLQPLFEIKGIDFYILQPGAKEAGWMEGFGIYLGEHSVHEYAQYIAALDLLISIDSMPVHLAGALGVPVWTMLQEKADWRWMNEGELSPWYPGMKLYRQQHAGEWDGVISRVKDGLMKLYK